MSTDRRTICAKQLTGPKSPEDLNDASDLHLSANDVGTGGQGGSDK